MYYMGVLYPQARRGNLAGKRGQDITGHGPGYNRTCLAVDIVNETQQEIAQVWCECRLEVYIGATWRIPLNRPCVVAMRPMSNYSDYF